MYVHKYVELTLAAIAHPYTLPPFSFQHLFLRFEASLIAMYKDEVCPCADVRTIPGWFSHTQLCRNMYLFV